jgi:SAM-dependent methyltransferase
MPRTISDVEMSDNNQEEMGKNAWDRLWSRSILTHGLRRLLPDFDHLIHTPYRAKINGLLEGVDFARNSVLELGCGSGMNSVNLLNDHSFQKATLVDFSDQALGTAKANTADHNVGLVCSDIFSLDLSERFDLVFSIGLIEHFTGERRSEAIAVHRRFTENDGLIMIIAPRKGALSPVSGLVNRIQGYKEYPFSDAEIEGLFQRNGLEVIKKDCMFLGIGGCYLLRCER